MARMMAVLIQMESNWAEKTAHLTLKAMHLAKTMAWMMAKE